MDTATIKRYFPDDVADSYDATATAFRDRFGGYLVTLKSTSTTMSALSDRNVSSCTYCRDGRYRRDNAIREKGHAMSREEVKEEAPDEIAQRIGKVGRYSRFVKIGFSIIIVAFLITIIGVLPYNIDSVPEAVNAVLLPLIFVGMAFLLLGIGMHLHLLHLNLVRQIQHRMTEEDDEKDTE